MFKRLLNFATHKIYNLPVIVLMPHSRCNCRCVMCDIWKANHDKKEISAEALTEHVDAFRQLGVREIVFSGGEALMHSNLWKLCALLKSANIRLTLLSTGLLLAKHAGSVVTWFDNVIISLDGSEPVHDRIRNVPGGFEKMRLGINALRGIRPGFRVTARCVLQRANYADFANIVSSAKQIGLDQISFLAADISSTAFNHNGMEQDVRSTIMLTPSDAIAFREIVETSFVGMKEEYNTRFIAESPEKILRIVAYYEALLGSANFSAPVCNAPWVSAVIESNGDVMPCFFHKPYGNIFTQDFRTIINSQSAVRFRKRLDVRKDETCKKCVCSLKLGLMSPFN